MEKISRELEKKSKERIKKKKEYDLLREKFLKLEKDILPQRFSYELFLCEGEKYLKFSGDLIYPVELLSSILESSKKDELRAGSRTIGLILQVPNPFHKKKGSKKSTKNRNKRRKNGKRTTTKS
tara:strand:- start:10313 stop:10684 length:372 start_codon:yes stop_codon:yes gene_type:complete